MNIIEEKKLQIHLSTKIARILIGHNIKDVTKFTKKEIHSLTKKECGDYIESLVELSKEEFQIFKEHQGSKPDGSEIKIWNYFTSLINFEIERQAASIIEQVAYLSAHLKIPRDQIIEASTFLKEQKIDSTLAFSQIKRFLLASKHILGERWGRKYTYQEAVGIIHDKAGGSLAQLKSLMGSIDAVNAVTAYFNKGDEYNITLYRADDYSKNSGSLVGIFLTKEGAINYLEHTAPANSANANGNFSQITEFKTKKTKLIGLNIHSPVHGGLEEFQDINIKNKDLRKFNWEDAQKIINSDIWEDSTPLNIYYYN